MFYLPSVTSFVRTFLNPLISTDLMKICARNWRTKETTRNCTSDEQKITKKSPESPAKIGDQYCNKTQQPQVGSQMGRD